jgi:hypothetical protein
MEVAMPALIDITDYRFERLVVLNRHTTNSADRKPLWRCQCDCGTKVIVGGSSLKSGNTRSCGCLHKEGNATTHGHTKGYKDSPTYNTWANMMTRCYNPKANNWDNYGGRGITVCERWHLFETFLEDVGERPEGKTIDRYPNNDGNYEPGNVRWATRSEQNQNKRPRKDSRSR